MTFRGDQDRMLILGGQAAIRGFYGPAVTLVQFYVALAGVDHRFDGQAHARFQDFASAGAAVMQNLWVFMEAGADAVTAVLADNGVVVAFGVLLDNRTDISQVYARFDQFNTQVHALLSHLAQTLGMGGDFTDEEHLAGIAVVTILNDGDVYIKDIALLEFFRSWDAVADHLVDRSADRLGEAVVIQRGRNRFLLVDDVVVADAVELFGGDARDDMRLDHLENFGSQTAGDAHFFDFIRGFDNDAHKAPGVGWSG